MTLKQFNAEKTKISSMVPTKKVMITSLVASILITGMIFVSSPQAFAGATYTGRICHYEATTGLWGIATPNLNGWLNGHEGKHNDGVFYDFQIPFDGSGDAACLALNGEEDPFDGFKSWTHTDYNWDPICDGVIIDEICYDNPEDQNDIGFRPANINNNDSPDDNVLADPLPQDGDDKYTAYVQIKKTGEISNMIPGAIYALTTVNIQANLDTLTVEENYSDCTFEMLDLLNQNKLSRNVKVAVADPNGDVTEITDRLYDELDLGVIFAQEIDNDSAIVEIDDDSFLTDGSTVFVLVKFDDKLTGLDSSILSKECINSEIVTSDIESNPFEKTFIATLIIDEIA